VLEVSERRRAFCRAQLLVESCLDGKEDPVRALEGLLQGDLPTAVFDATGNPASMMKAPQYVAHGGKLVMVGLVQADLSFHDPDLHRRELTLLRSRNATGSDFAWVIRMLEEGKIEIKPWITHRAPAEKMIPEFPSWLDPDRGVIKALVEF
jgi:hypothetical protein